MPSLGLGFEDAVPDAKTVWLFHEHLTRGPGAIDDLFAASDCGLKGKGYLAMSGQIIAAPRQRDTDAEKAALKEGRRPEAWAANPKKLARKDRDARWTLKRARARPAKADGTKAKVEIAVPMFGDGTHVSLDRRHGVVCRFSVISAAAHDGAQLPNVLDLANTASEVSCRHGLPLEAHLANHGRRSKIHVRRQPGHDQTPSRRKANRACSKVCSAVETVFAGRKHRFDLFVRTIGLARARSRRSSACLNADPITPEPRAASNRRPTRAITRFFEVSERAIRRIPFPRGRPPGAAARACVAPGPRSALSPPVRGAGLFEARRRA